MSSAIVEVATDPPYPVHVGVGILAQVAPLVAGGGAAILADERVQELHGARLAGLAEVPRLTLPAGEGTKSLARLGDVLEFLSAAGCSRESTVVTLGGGVIGDLGGLAASLFKRGVAVLHCPTTLLSQVDASVGGKTAINLSAGKNLAGTFHQPRAVFADTETLATLPPDELASGSGEVLKTALIGGEGALRQLEEHACALAAGEPTATAAIVRECVATKARVVAEDPHERGPRRALNLGHTFAHAIEHAAGYGSIPHGIAVATGIGLALRASARLGLLEDPALEERLTSAADALSLPFTLGALRARSGAALEGGALLAGLAHDKKGRVGAPEFVLVKRAGELELGVSVDARLLTELLA